ncbi:ABC transporter ATP-binding protein [Gordonia sputi]
MTQAREPSTYRSLARLVLTHRVAVAGGAALLLLATLLGIAQPLVTKKIIDGVSAHSVSGPLVLTLAVLFVSQGIVEGVGTFLVARAGEKTVLTLREAMITRFTRLQVGVMARYRSGDLASRVGADASILREDATTSPVRFLVYGVSALTVLGVMVALSPLLTLITFGTTVVAGAMLILALSGIRDASEKVQESVGELTTETTRVIDALRTVKAAQAEDREAGGLIDSATRAMSSGIRAAKYESTVQPATTLAMNGSFLILLLVGGARVASGDMGVGTLVAFLLFTMQLIAPVASTMALLASVQRGMGGYRRIVEAAGLPVETHEQVPHKGIVAAHSSSNNPAVEFENVTFSHGDREIIAGLSFTVPAGTQLALVGSSGSGKTTLFDLIERFYEADSGVVRVFGSDVQDLPVGEFRSRIALVEQTSPVMFGTLRENLTYGAVNADDKAIAEAMTLSNLNDLVGRLPLGLDTQIGEHGSTLSGGERQRVAIARAFLMEADLVLLDEPTSNLDAENAQDIVLALEGLKRRGTTVIIASHSDAAVRGADQMIVVG